LQAEARAREQLVAQEAERRRREEQARVAAAAQARVPAAAMASPVAPAPPRGRRVALVVGNGDYVDRPLRNPPNDARLMQRTLAGMGFEVQLVSNADRRGLLEGLRDFESRLREAEVAVFYFAGHGAQVGGTNYLIPVGAQIQGSADVADEAVDVHAVLRRIEAGRPRVGLVILDACRDNPYADTRRSAERGLARMNAPTGTIVAYATAPGRTAADGTAENGVYTSQLVRHLTMPGLDIKEVFDRTAQEVERLTNGQQQPREDIGLRGRFVLNHGEAGPPSVVPAAPLAAPGPAPTAPAVVPPPALTPIIALAPLAAPASLAGAVSTSSSVGVPDRPAEPSSAGPDTAGRIGGAVEVAPSRSYGGLLVAAIRPNIVYTDLSDINYETEVFVTARSDGRITAIRVTKPSGSRVWDDAVVRALERTERLPADINGQVPAQITREGLLVTLRPRDLAAR